MFRAKYISFSVGCAVPLTLMEVWHLVDAGSLPVSLPNQYLMSSITLLLCPSSFLLTGVRSDVPPWRIDAIILYLTVIGLNGLFYFAVVRICQKIFRNSLR
jgi:hypothetical protein